MSLHMSRIYVGTEAQLMPNVRLRGFLQERLITMALGAQILLGISILFAYFCRPNDPLFSWLGALVVVASIVSVGLFVEFRTGSQDIRIYAAALAPAVGFLFIGVALALVGVRRRPMPCASWPRSFPGPGLEHPGWLVTSPLAASISFSIVFAAFVVAAGIVAWGAFQRGNIEARLMLSPFFLICWFAVRDMGVSTGLLEGSVLLTPYVRPLFLAAIMSVLMWRLAPVSISSTTPMKISISSSPHGKRNLSSCTGKSASKPRARSASRSVSV